jgi:hypothetical protein
LSRVVGNRVLIAMQIGSYRNQRDFLAQFR